MPVVEPDDTPQPDDVPLRRSSRRSIIVNMIFKVALSVLSSLLVLGSTQEVSLGNLTDLLNAVPKMPELTPCTCGVFLSGQFNRTSPVRGNPVLMNEHNEHFACTNMGNKQCINKCLDVLVRHLANSPAIICGAIDRDCHKERAYLFYKNCNDKWVNSNLSAGREYCCKDGSPFKCP
ncbi:hypothetical protein GE061_017866 [Apolygus lucorum]|uniref:Follicle cell protein 3C-1 n=1 Tax=Apolygus lucorum TaxID=248454 RepID=A0A8S9XC30_APOLU|nr:hypothetical protein GE061_017866 [Apolygus lucorum]